MEKIKVNLKGGVLCPDDIIEYNGQPIPNIQRINISAGHDVAPRLDIFTIMPHIEAEIEPYNATIIQIKAGGVSIEDARSLLVERDLLKAKCDELEKQLNASDG